MFFIEPQICHSNNIFEFIKDRPGILTSKLELNQISIMAKKLSSDRRWLTKEVLFALDQLSLRVDELFSEAPRFIMKDDVSYEIKLEKVGDLWAKFDPKSDPYIVFLAHEIYNGLGEQQALGFQDGMQLSLTEFDLKEFPAIAITMQKTDITNQPNQRNISQSQFNQPIQLGRLQIALDRSQNKVDRTNFDIGIPSKQTRNQCQPITGVSACTSQAQAICSNGGNAHFIIDELRIKTEREGPFKGAPEFELYPLALNGTITAPPANASTPLIFDGRFVIDAAGRSIYLPDVNNKNTNFDINNGLALPPFTFTDQLSIVAVEDDSVAGELRPTTSSLTTAVFSNAPGVISVILADEFDLLKFFKEFAELVAGIFSSDNDDVFNDAIGITNTLMCNAGLSNGAPIRESIVLDVDEWRLKGSFACIDITCDPLETRISGPDNIFPDEFATWTAITSGGDTPYTYEWRQNFNVVSTSQSVTANMLDLTGIAAFTLVLTVTDNEGTVVTDSIVVDLFNESGCFDGFICL